MRVNDQVFVCPDCGSTLVEFSGLVGGTADCKVCPWRGTREKLVAVPFTNELGDEQTILAIRGDIRAIVKDAAPSILQVLVRWGFVEATQSKSGQVSVKNKQMVVRYMNAVAHHVFLGIIEERKKIEVERVTGN
jgi:hypothetical protein